MSMDWFVVRHPETGGVGCIAESALDIHRNNGWVRVSDAVAEGEKQHLNLTVYAAAADLDAPPAKGKTFIKES